MSVWNKMFGLRNCCNVTVFNWHKLEKHGFWTNRRNLKYLTHSNARKLQKLLAMFDEHFYVVPSDPSYIFSLVFSPVTHDYLSIQILIRFIGAISFWSWTSSPNLHCNAYTYFAFTNSTIFIDRMHLILLSADTL